MVFTPYFAQAEIGKNAPPLVVFVTNLFRKNFLRQTNILALSQIYSQVDS